MQSIAARDVFLEHVRKVEQPEAYYSNTCAEYSTGSAVAAAMAEIGEASAPEVSARSVFL